MPDSKDISTHFGDLRSIVTNAPAIFILVNDDLVVRYVNRVIGGYTMDMVLGSPVLGFVKEKYVEQQRAMFEATREDGKVRTSEVKVIFADESEHWMMTQVSRTHDPEPGFVILCWLIDEQKRAEYDLKLSEAKFRTISENLPETVFVVDQRGQIAYLNRPLEMGNPSQVIGTSFIDMWNEEQQGMVRDHLAEVFHSGKRKSFETYRKSKGRTIWESHQLGPIEVQERIEFVIVTTNDITEQKAQDIKEREFNRRLERLVHERTEELEKANKEIRTLLKEMHHRVKNNLQLVSSLLNLQSSFVDDEKTSELLNESINRINSMSLIHKSLYYNERLADIDVVEYIEGLVRERINTHRMHQVIEYHVEIPDLNFNIDTMVPIGLLINELVTNSIKHAFHDRESGKIFVKIEKTGNSSYKITYSDNGVGIPEEAKEPEDERSLGLELIDCFVEQLNGRMDLTSTAEGVTFSIEFTD